MQNLPNATVLQFLIKHSQKMSAATLRALAAYDMEAAEANDEHAKALFEPIMDMLGELDKSISYSPLNTPIGQGNDAVGHYSQQLAAGYGAPFARVGSMGTSHFITLALGFAAPKLTSKRTVLLDSGAHMSSIGAMVQNGLYAEWLERTYVPEKGIHKVITSQQVEDALSANPDIGIVFLTSPDYNGNFCDIAAIAKVCRRFGVILLIDGAWSVGAGLIRGFPASPITQGAIASTISLHKKGIGGSQLAGIVMADGRFAEYLDRAQAVFSTTSPNFVSLAMAQIAFNAVANGDLRKVWEQIPATSHLIRSQVDKIHPDLRVLSACDAGATESDASHIVFHLGKLGITGFELEAALQERQYIAEKGTYDTLLILVGPAQIGEEDALIDTLTLSIKDCLGRSSKRTITNAPILPTIPKESVMTIRDAFYAQDEYVDMSEAVGRICADVIAPCPPGISLAVPGVRLEKETIDYLQFVDRIGGKIRGMDMARGLIRVIKQ